MATTGPSLKRTSIMQCKESVARILFLDAQSQLFACNWTTAASSYPLTGSEKLFGGVAKSAFASPTTPSETPSTTRRGKAPWWLCDQRAGASAACAATAFLVKPRSCKLMLTAWSMGVCDSVPKSATSLRLSSACALSHR